MSIEKVKILLLGVSSQSFFYDQVVIPFGLISLASYIDDGSYVIKGIEMNSPSERIPKRYLNVDEELLKEILAFSPDIVAMSTYASNIYNVLFWADIIKKKLPHCFIIIGGNHASYIAQECLEKSPGLDMVVKFEGEIPFKMICEKIKNKDYDFSNIPSLVYRANGDFKENSQGKMIKNLSDLPLLNRDYFADKTKSNNNVIHADVISARGCPYNCTFCDCNHYWNKVYRVRLIDSVIEELKLLKMRYPNLKSVRFRDESITINKERCRRLSEALIKNELNLELQAHSRLDGLNESIIKMLAAAGFVLIFIGMESGSQKVLERLQKGINISRAEEIVSLLRKYGIKFRISFMSSTPNEKFSDILHTIKLIKKLNLKSNEYYIGTGVDIYPGTKECDIFLKLNPKYKWLSRSYDFKGRYRGIKDSKGNILHPSYGEHGTALTILYRIVILLILSNPTELVRYFKRIIRRSIRRIINLFN